ncbi:MAG TPA: patatin-like phospholipase family protein [Bacteroidales bacterium]|nr:patatin-like phospholipase family protein [Bacteroidales bacterium]
MKRDIALVLSSGGARGFAHIGAIKVLEQNGYNIRSVSGTSMGALVGGIYATGQLREFEEWVSALDIREVLSLTDLTISSKGLVKGKKIIEKMKEIVPDRNIEDLSIPFCAVATDIIKGSEQIFTSGKLFDAIRASISIPTVFQPFKIGRSYYVDGGVVNPVPINRVKRHKNDLLVVVAVNANIPYKKKVITPKTTIDNKYLKQIMLIQKKLSNDIPRNRKDDIGLFNLTNRSISIMLNQIALLTIGNHRVDIMVNISKDAFGTYDFYKASEIIQEGEEATTRALSQFNKKQ